MYLKSIEVQGFKSFANKMVFEFHNGITAIVGPNGSGKSNVADAVRWVLGEQSAKQLRGSRMEDVIFSGTETRRPQGFAYVAITLNNSDHKLAADYEEVTVARRVYRSGESEYLINGVNCRLRDVQELFLDTGIGKEGYSIIGQGQIDKILSGRPEERRELFDEAAGIVKFKKRKAAAEKNLEAEHQNLCRIHDILKEIETQIGPLEKQSAVAKEYLNLRDRLRSCDINMFLEEYQQNHENMEAISKKEGIAAQDLEEVKTAYNATKTEYDRLESILDKKSALAEEKRNALSEVRIRKEQQEGEIKVLKEQILAARQNREHYKEREAQALEGIEKKKEQLEQKEQVLALAKANCADTTLRQQKEEEGLALQQEKIKQLTDRIDSCKSEMFQSLNASTDVKTNLQRYETMLEQSSIKKSELNQRLLKSKSEEAVLDEQIKEAGAQLKTLSDNIARTEKDLLKHKEEEEEISGQIKVLSGEWEQLSQSFHREDSRLYSLKNMTERYEGYGQSIRRVMEQKEKNPGIIGVVADIIKVEKNYETAVETALGGSIQNIVTDNEITAKNLIGFLKQNRCGRATFLPLTAISGKGGIKNAQALKEPGSLGIASSLVKVEKQFQSLAEYLLGRILVVDHIDHAIAIAKKYGQSIRIVTLEGDLLQPGGSMSGGAYKNTSSLLSRRREMEDLEGQIKGIQSRMEETDRRRKQLKEKRQAVLLESEKGRSNLQNLYLQQNTAKLEYEQASVSKESRQLLLDEIAFENNRIEKEASDLKTNIQKLKSILYSNETMGRERENEIAEYEKQLAREKVLEEEQRNALEKIKLEALQKEQSRQFDTENARRIQEEIKELERALKNLREGLEKTDALAAEKEKETLKVKNSVEALKNQIILFEKELEDLKQNREEIEKSHKEFFGKREALSSRINELDKECFRLSSQKEKLSEQMEGQMNYMWEQYELTYNNALAAREDNGLSYTQLKKEAGELKNQIRRLGDVNVNAIEDYKNMSERYELLKTQHDDLIESEAALREIIKELDMEMRNQFAIKFEEIRTEFDKVFKELFGGGKGTIELVEEEDILEAGIRIIAQPPGKKLQNMMQLSGGEKALTAISLLFAIQNLKPSPFCLLDEIEAALDDSNVSRFANYLHKLTKYTQFIVITHRRGTMSAADILYGITMQEKGVSTLVSVNLLEKELEH